MWLWIYRRLTIRILRPVALYSDWVIRRRLHRGFDVQNRALHGGCQVKLWL